MTKKKMHPATQKEAAHIMFRLRLQDLQKRGRLDGYFTVLEYILGEIMKGDRLDRLSALDNAANHFMQELDNYIEEYYPDSDRKD